jgi:hypothetical protein
MNQSRIETCYRNLLITLARDAEDLRKQVVVIHLAVHSEQSNGKRAGMRTLINARNRQRARLLQLLGRNKAALSFFFQTTDAATVAAQIILQ